MMRRLRKVAPWFRRVKRNGYRLDRCEGCGHRFRWARDARHSTGNRDGKVWHGPCLSLVVWRTKADERLDVLGLALDLSPLEARDVKVAAELRAADDAERIASSHRAFRVFRDLERL